VSAQGRLPQAVRDPEAPPVRKTVWERSTAIVTPPLAERQGRAQAAVVQRGDSKLLADEVRGRPQARYKRVKLSGAPARREPACDSSLYRKLEKSADW
jgi:hypothetical protein